MPNAITIIDARNEIGRNAPDSDETIIRLFLHGRCDNTRSAYERDIAQFRKSVSKPLRSLSLGDLQGYADTLEASALSASSRHRKLTAVRSLLRFAHAVGYTSFDVGRPLRLPKFQDRLSERILSESDVQRMIGLEEHLRNRSILIALYGLGCRVTELCRLSVRDCHGRDDGTGNITLYGKGSKTNVVFAPAPIWSIIEPLIVGRGQEDAVFRSRHGKRLRRETVTRIVAAAAKRARIEKAVSAHWMRHAHASHAIDRGSPISLVTAQLSHSSCAVTSRYVHARVGDSSSRYLPL
jgi:integrase/recombinase XerD